MARRLTPPSWAVILILLWPEQGSARILKTRTGVTSSGAFLNSLVVGSGFELQSDRTETDYEFPLLVECNLTRDLKLTLEPDFVYISAKSKDARTVGGTGDLETSVEYEFLHERRYRPALTATSIIRWPTASDPDLGNPGHDYSLGLIVSKDLVYCDLDLNLLYTFVGDPDEQDNFEAGLAVEWHLTHRLDLIGEIVSTLGNGGVHGGLGTLTGGPNLSERTGSNNQFEATLGVAYHLSKYLKLEHGVTHVSDQNWQFQFAWEWSFGGD
jgi:hypothetical protein